MGLIRDRIEPLRSLVTSRVFCDTEEHEFFLCYTELHRGGTEIHGVFLVHQGLCRHRPFCNIEFFEIEICENLWEKF